MGVLNTTPATVTPGQLGASALWNVEVRDALTLLQSGWTPFTPVFASGVTLGNGSLAQSYRQTGKTVEVRGTFTLGATSSFTASAVLQVPVPIGTYLLHAVLGGGGGFWDNSAAVGYPLMPEVVSLTTGGFGSIAFYVPVGGVVNASLPVVGATSDILSWHYQYEAA